MKMVIDEECNRTSECEYWSSGELPVKEKNINH